MRFDLRFNRANGLFGLLVSGFMLLSVACSHTRTASNQLDGLSEEAELSESRSTASVDASSDTSSEAAEEVAEAPKVEAPRADASQSEDFAVPSAMSEAPANPAVVEAPVTPESNDLVAMAEADLKAIGEAQETSAPDAVSAPVTTVRAHPFESKGKPQKANSDLAEFTDLVAKSIQVPPEEIPEAQLASSDFSQLIERNLVWLVGLLTIGTMWVFVVVRRNRKARFNSPF